MVPSADTGSDEIAIETRRIRHSLLGPTMSRTLALYKLLLSFVLNTLA